MARMWGTRWLCGAALAGAAALAGRAAEPAAHNINRPVVLKEAGKPDSTGTVLKTEAASNGDAVHTVRTQSGETVKVIEPKADVAVVTAGAKAEMPAVSSTVIPGACEADAPVVKPVAATAKTGVGRLFSGKPSAPTKAPTVVEFAPPRDVAQPVAKPGAASIVTEPGRASIVSGTPGIAVIGGPPSAVGTTRITPVSAGRTSETLSTDNMLTVLKEALQPSHREAAAEGLATLAAKSPAVRQELCAACISDPAATVRATCVVNLARHAPKDAEVIATVKAAAADADSRVSGPAKLALERMGVK